GSGTSGNTIAGNYIGTNTVGGTQLSGLTSWWKAEGNANDAVGGNNGTLINGATFAAGEVGQAFSFNGNQSAVQMATTALNSAYGALTIDAWVKPAANGHDTSNTYGLAVLSRTDGDGFALRVKDGFVQADLRLTGGDRIVTFPGQVAALPL